MNINRNIIDESIFKIYNGTAKYKRSYTYNELIKNWEDERPVPTESEINKAYLSVYKKETNGKVNLHRDNKLIQPIVYETYKFDSDRESYQNLSGFLTDYNELPEGFPGWWDIDNIPRLKTIEKIKGLKKAMSDRTLYLMDEARKVKDDIENASTLDEVDEIYNNYIGS